MNLQKFTGSIKFRIFSSFLILVLFAVASTLFFLNYTVRSYRPQPVEIPETMMFQMGRREASVYISTRIEDERQSAQNRVLVASLILLSVQLVVAVGASILLAKNIISPLEEINTLMKDINEKMLYKQLSVDNVGQLSEITELAESFNAMMSRLNAAFAAQKEFVENASHEIKTPLTVIKTNLESILFNKNATKADITEAIETAVTSINFLDRLTEDLLLLSLVEKDQIARSEFNISQTIQEVVTTHEVIAKRNGQQLILSAIDDPLVVHAHENLINRAISNLIENALKYSPKSSKIEVSLSKETENLCKIIVKDEGAGIPKQHIKQIFDRFYRIDKSRSRLTGGSGLGLAITKQIITQFGGTLSVKSNSHGTIFTINLPTVTTILQNTDSTNINPPSEKITSP